MINNVRKTVLSVLNKNNYGYISPDDFNMYARQAQLEVFEQYFYNLNKANNAVNMRKVGVGYEGLNDKLTQDIDKFHVTAELAVSGDGFAAPSIATTNDVAFKIMGLDLYDTAPSTKAFVGTAELISQAKLRPLMASNLTAPSYSSAVYVENQGIITPYPEFDTPTLGQVEARYVRYPKDPKWTYMAFGNGEPLFDATATDFQDFEVSLSEETELINKILQMAGMSIREIEAVKQAGSEEVERKTDQG